MGKPTSNSDLPPYRDDPSLDDALSLHTTAGESSREQDNLPDFNPGDSVAVPPPYLDNEEEQPLIDENPFASEPEGVIWRAKTGILSVSHPVYDRNSEYLSSSVFGWSKVPPAFYIKIIGTHTESTKRGDKKETEKVVDFDMKIRMTEYLFTHGNDSQWKELHVASEEDKTFRGTVLKTRSKASGVGLESGPTSVQEWCEHYVNNKATLKRFVFKREVGGVDKKLLEENLTSLIRNTNYRGHLQITFPTENPGIEVYSYHWVNKARNNMIVIILSIITATIIIIWPIITLLTKRYDVVKEVWWFSKQDECTGRQVYATMSEVQWFNKWRQCIEKNALRRRQGVLTEEDLAHADDPEPPSTGNSLIDTAAGLFGAGISAYRETNRQLGWGGDS